MNSWKIILATVVIFGAGVMTGGLLVEHVNHARPNNRRPPAAPRPLEDSVPRPEILKTNFVQRLDDAVHLTSEQRDKIEKIIADGQQKNRELWKIVAQPMRDAMQETRQHIRETLTPDQKKQFEELFKHSRRPANATNAPPVAPAPAKSPIVSTNAP